MYKAPRLTQLQPGYCALGGTDTSGPHWVCAAAGVAGGRSLALLLHMAASDLRSAYVAV